MTFQELYGAALDQELGSVDRTERFTPARRKSAINLAQQEFVRLTDCFTREAQVDLTDLAEYDLEAVINDQAFLRFTDQQPWLKCTDSNSRITTYSGRDFPRVDISVLDREQPGWRSSGASSPVSWYLREDGGSVFLGVQPAPNIPAGSTWAVFVPYSAYPAVMVGDDDEPFCVTAGGNSKTTLRVYHQALVHHAASSMEKLRRNYEARNEQLQLFGTFVSDYKEHRQPTGGTRVSLERDCFAEVSRHGRGVTRYGY